MRIEICTDCRLAHGGYDEHEMGYVPTVEPLNLLADCYDLREIDSEAFFSSRKCDGCGDVAGDRFQFECAYV